MKKLVMYVSAIAVALTFAGCHGRHHHHHDVPPPIHHGAVRPHPKPVPPPVPPPIHHGAVRPHPQPIPPPVPQPIPPPVRPR